MVKYIRIFEEIAEELAYLIPNALSNLNKQPKPEFYFNTLLIKALFNKIQKQKTSSLERINFKGQNINLTARETEVLELIRLNYSNRKIAEALNISPRTVEKHINSLKEKYGCDKNRLVLHTNFQRTKFFNKRCII